MKPLSSQEKHVWIPDFVAESQGTACGDRIFISSYRQGEFLFFSFVCKACSVATQTAHILQYHFSGKQADIISQAMTRYSQGIFLSEEYTLQSLFSTCPECAVTPVRLIKKALLYAPSCSYQSREQDSILSCDACVSIRPILWEDKTKRENKHTSIRKQISKLGLAKEGLYQQIALCEPQGTREELFLSVLASFAPQDMKTIKRLRIAAPLYNNARKLGHTLPPGIQELAIKQQMSLLIAETEIEVINTFITNNSLSIYPVKGERTKEMYPVGHFRAHMDFDYLAANANDAYCLISYLINERMFKLVTGGSVPISLKCIADFEKNEHITGHIHLEKIIQNQYQVIVDINWGGFPLGRTGLIRVQDREPLQNEDIICITLAHLFKHERAFIKDLNDLYYLLRSKGVQANILYRKLEEHRLVFFYDIVHTFLKNIYPNQEHPKVKGSLFTAFILRMGWPFNPKAHLVAKTVDLFLRSVKQYGLRQGTKETLNQLRGEPGNLASSENTSLFSALNTRTYLYPLVIFSNLQPAPPTDKVNCSICHGMILYHDILYLPFGLFLIQKEDAGIVSRETTDQHLTEILTSMGITPEDCNYTFIKEARKDLWLY